jgi:hypothetical protein
MARDWLKDMETRSRIMRYPVSLVELAMAQVDTSDAEDIWDIEQYDGDELEMVLSILQKGSRANVASKLVTMAKNVLAEDSPLDGLRNDAARRTVSKLLRSITKGLHRDQAWNPVTKLTRAFSSEGYDWNQPEPSRYSATPFWRRILEEIDGKNSPNDKKEWHFTIEYVNNRGRPQTMHIRLIANATGPVGAGRDVWDTYDIDFSVY